MYPVCNDTKWNELREAMLSLPAETRPKWRSLSLNGFDRGWYDWDWSYHFFAGGGYRDLRHVDIASTDETTDAAVLAAIRTIGLAASRLEHLVWRVYGYVDDTNLARTP
jgi:hypothetical protein